MLNRAASSSPPSASPVKPPERCPHCGRPKIATKGRRLKKLETIRLYHCRSCDRLRVPLRRDSPSRTAASPAFRLGHAVTIPGAQKE